MRMLIDVLDPLPPGLNRSYDDFGYYNFGLCCWVYRGYCGVIEWINTRQFCTEPKYADPDGLQIWMKKDVLYVYHMDEVSAEIIPPIKANQQPFNPVTGEGFPVFLGNST